MAQQRPNRVRYTPLKGRQDSTDLRPSERKKRCYKNIITVFLFIIVLHYSYTYYWLSADIADPFEDIPGNIDEYLTTQHPDDENDSHLIDYFKNDGHIRYYRVNATYKVLKKRIMPRCIRAPQSGRTQLNTSKINLSDLDKEYPMVQNGGLYSPPNCSARQIIAIIVAYRGRDTNLAIFLYNMHPFLMGQQHEYQIFVIEQSGTDLFNKGRLFNVGFKEVVKLNKFHCVVFHDLDLLPAFLEISYSCPTLPRHLSSAIDHRLVRKLKQSYQYKSLFGGVVSMTIEMFEIANGYSNIYFGWGGEDNDLFWRLRAVGYPIMRYNKTIGVFTVLPHTRAPVNKYRHNLLARAVERYKKDGLSNLEYVVISNKSHHLYTHFLVDINPRKQNVTALTIRWAAGDDTF